MSKKKVKPPHYQKEALKRYRHLLRNLIDFALTNNWVRINHTYHIKDGIRVFRVTTHREGELARSVWSIRNQYGGFEAKVSASQAKELVRAHYIRAGISVDALNAAENFDDG